MERQAGVTMATEWMDQCAGKLTSLAGAISLIKPGKRIYLSDGSATPLGLIPGLIDPQADLGDNEITHLLTLGDAPYVKPEFAARFRHNALFIGANVREAVRDGRADYTPAFLSEIPALIRSGRLPIDVALISVTPPDENGYCSFGTHIDLAPAVVEVAELVIAEVNPLMPRVPSPARIHVDDIDALVLAEHALPELPPPPDNEVTTAIGLNVADLIPNGATLQVGIGAVPNAILGCLFDHQDLGVHSELISDGVMRLAQRGVINGERKTLNRGKVISSFVMGTRACYDFVRDNPHVELHPVDYTNDVVVISQHDSMIAINTGLEVDLTGQVCSDSIGERFYSGIGGQVDFIRGAARSRGGKPIIAMPSTAQSGTISRIVPRLGRGAGVVTTRGDVHWVVTEWGAVNLHGLNVRERAMALVSIAHPKFRPWLLAEGKRSKLIYLDQLEPPLETPVYPRRLETHARLDDGTEVLIRPIKPTDESLLHGMFYRLSQETIYKRFCGIVKYMPHKNLQRFCTVDYERDMTLVATTRQGELERVVGLATYNLNPQTGFAEMAMLVDDAFQRRGIGKLLMRRMTELAKARQVRGFTAYTLGYNSPMLCVFQCTGFAVEVTPEGEGFAVRIPFDDAPRPDDALRASRRKVARTCL
jgi:acyl-CoA hydrolase/GNAT superfamily N-acetyltransferase